MQDNKTSAYLRCIISFGIHVLNHAAGGHRKGKAQSTIADDLPKLKLPPEAVAIQLALVLRVKFSENDYEFEPYINPRMIYNYNELSEYLVIHFQLSLLFP